MITFIQAIQRSRSEARGIVEEREGGGGMMMRPVKQGALLLLLGLIFVTITTAKATQVNSSAQVNVPTQVSVPIQSPAAAFLDIFYKIVISVVGIVGPISCVYFGIKYVRSLKKVLNKIEKFVDKVLPDLDCYKKMAWRTNSFMEKPLPEILRSLEDRELIDKGAHSNLITIISSDTYNTGSRKRLSESGFDLLANSKMKRTIDENITEFIQILENADLKNPSDVEEASLTLLKDQNKENEKIAIHFKNYLFEHPEGNIGTILLVGALYLRDIYLKKHPELEEKGDFE